MNNPDLYNSSNRIQRHITLSTLKENIHKIKWDKIESKALDLGCGDGSVSVLVKNLVPCRYKKFVACDISEEMTTYGKKRYANEGITFRVVDMEGSIPKDLKYEFTHVFSFYALHWARDQDKLFRNIYDLMADDGDCFMTFMGHGAIYSAYIALAQAPKWKSWLKNVDGFISAYHSVEDPETTLTERMKKCGFKNIDVSCKNIVNPYTSVKELRAFVQSIEPYNMPEDVMDEFIVDYVAISQDLGLLHFEDKNNTESPCMTHDILIVVHASK